MTKEELQNVLENAQNQIEDLVKKDNQIRKEISLMFKSLRLSRDRYGEMGEEGVVLSWPQIYFKLGQQITDDEVVILRGKIDHYEGSLDQLTEQVQELDGLVRPLEGR